MPSSMTSSNNCYDTLEQIIFEQGLLKEEFSLKEAA